MGGNKNVFYQGGDDEDDIEEEIVDNDEEIFNGGGLNARQLAEIDGIGASTSLGIDQSIDTLRLEEYDYIEEVKFY